MDLLCHTDGSWALSGLWVGCWGMLQVLTMVQSKQRRERGQFFCLQWVSVLTYFCRGRTTFRGEKMLQRTALSLTVSYRFGVFFCFPVTVSSSPETCVCFSDCSQQCAAALTSLAALPLGYCFGLSRSTSTLLAWPASLIEFLIMSVSAANT